jgi:UDP-N-acetylglucosamine 3-dehydrogenase
MALRGAVLGLGMMGRNHARLLQASPRVEFAGAVDGAGDVHRALHDPASLHGSLDELLDAGRPDFAIVALPTDQHAEAAIRLAELGVHVLVEKPLAESAERAEDVIAAVREAGVHGAVGHVERFNPALLKLRALLQDGRIGDPFLVATERIGPFPGRVSDVGVVKDLATHDLDLVGWLARSPIAVVAAQTTHKMGREHEDLVAVTGRLEGGAVFNSLVDWLTPTKVRRTRVLGEAGMLLANTLTGDLTLFQNPDVDITWDANRLLRGVSEGDSIRFALERREPLLVELETFCDLLEGDAGAAVVSLEDGLAAVRCAEAVLDSAERGLAVEVG